MGRQLARRLRHCAMWATHLGTRLMLGVELPNAAVEIGPTLRGPVVGLGAKTGCAQSSSPTATAPKPPAHTHAHPWQVNPTYTTPTPIHPQGAPPAQSGQEQLPPAAQGGLVGGAHRAAQPAAAHQLPGVGRPGAALLWAVSGGCSGCAAWRRACRGLRASLRLVTLPAFGRLRSAWPAATGARAWVWEESGEVTV